MKIWRTEVVLLRSRTKRDENGIKEAFRNHLFKAKFKGKTINPFEIVQEFDKQ